jgi:hypothetical protein
MGAQATPDIRQAEWEKLLQISIVSGFAASTLGYREPGAFAYGDRGRPAPSTTWRWPRSDRRLHRAWATSRDFFAVLAVPGARGELVRRRCRRHPRPRHRAWWRTGSSGVRRCTRTSCGAPTEVDDSLGAYLAEADRQGIAAPTRGAYRVIKALKRSRPRAGAHEHDARNSRCAAAPAHARARARAAGAHVVPRGYDDHLAGHITIKQPDGAALQPVVPVVGRVHARRRRASTSTVVARRAVALPAGCEACTSRCTSCATT